MTSMEGVAGSTCLEGKESFVLVERCLGGGLLVAREPSLFQLSSLDARGSM